MVFNFINREKSIRMHFYSHGAVTKEPGSMEKKEFSKQLLLVHNGGAKVLQLKHLVLLVDGTKEKQFVIYERKMLRN